MFVDPANPMAGVPSLSGTGAEIRHLIPILRFVWRKYADAALARDQHVDLLLTSLSDIYSILGWKTETAEVPRFLSTDASDELKQLIDIFLTEQTFLEQLALARVPPINLSHSVSKKNTVCGIWPWNRSSNTHHLHART